MSAIPDATMRQEGRSDPGITRVLVVDDDHDLRRVLTLALRDEGYEVEGAPDGLAALQLLARWQPHIIVLDLMMPGLNGWGFRARQLATPGAADIPVVVLSAARDLSDHSLQAAAVVPKPFDLPRLLETIADLAP